MSAADWFWAVWVVVCGLMIARALLGMAFCTLAMRALSRDDYEACGRWLDRDRKVWPGPPQTWSRRKLP